MLLRDVVAQIGISAGAAALISSVVVFLTRTWIAEGIKAQIKSEYDQRLETHKAQLKAASDVEIERLKSQLSIAASEKQTKFSHLHQRRADTIAETYKLLQRVLISLRDYTKAFEPAGGPSREERRAAAANDHRAVRNYFDDNRLYVPKEATSKIEEINRDLVSSFNEFAILIDRNPSSDVRKWVEIIERIEQKIKVALLELEQDFRKALGED